MPKPTTRRAPLKSSSTTKAKTKTTAKAATVTPEDEAAYLEMLTRTGQAVPAGRGKLPAGATHVVVTDENGATKAVRRRVSIA